MTMNKFKIEYLADQKFLVVHGQKGQQISEREYYAISKGQIPGLLRAQLVRKGNTFRLNYNISGYISLREFLVNPLSKSTFVKLLGNILDNLKFLQNAYYNYQFILMDMNAAMVNPATQQVSFVYVPITFYESGTNLKDFLLGIIQCCSFIPGENTDYVRDYIIILNSGINFSLFDLEEYVKRLKIDEHTVKNVKKCTHCGSVILPNVNFCSSCGMKISGLNTDDRQGIYDPAESMLQPLKKGERLNYSAVNGKEQYCESVSVNVINGDGQVRAYIFRIKTGEQIPITSNLFRVGKDPNACEYCVRNNPAVSRCHILIKRVNGKPFLTDLNSTNKTYIDGKMILPNTDIQLYDGMNIRLANEDFIFKFY